MSGGGERHEAGHSGHPWPRGVAHQITAEPSSRTRLYAARHASLSIFVAMAAAETLPAPASATLIGCEGRAGAESEQEDDRNSKRPTRVLQRAPAATAEPERAPGLHSHGGHAPPSPLVTRGGGGASCTFSGQSQPVRVAQLRGGLKEGLFLFVFSLPPPLILLGPNHSLPPPSVFSDLAPPRPSCSLFSHPLLTSPHRPSSLLSASTLFSPLFISPTYLTPAPSPSSLRPPSSSFFLLSIFS